MLPLPETHTSIPSAIKEELRELCLPPPSVANRTLNCSRTCAEERGEGRALAVPGFQSENSVPLDTVIGTLSCVCAEIADISSSILEKTPELN